MNTKIFYRVIDDIEKTAKKDRDRPGLNMVKRIDDPFDKIKCDLVRI